MRAREGVRAACAALLVGALAGGGAVVLAAGVSWAQRAYAAHGWLGWALPLAGLLTLGVYHALRVEWGASTAGVIDQARGRGEVPAALAPAILAGTCLTVAGGGSVGKEAAALQLGGALGSLVWGRATESLRAWRTGEGLDGGALSRAAFVRAGMAGAFAALFYAPVAAVLFVCEVTRLRVRPATVAPLALAAACGAAVARLFPAGLLWHALQPQAMPVRRLAGTLAVALACACAAFAFCRLLALARRLWPTREAGARRAEGLRARVCDVLCRPWAHMALGGLAVAAVAHLAGLGAYAGTGDVLMRAAFDGNAQPGDFLAKAALTLLVLGSGFKGGEIMPVMAVGASLGCVVGPLAGAEAGPCAALGAVCMLGACTNCPLAAVALAVEAFGPAMGWTSAVGVALSWALTAPVGLYPQNCPGSYRALLARLRPGRARH